MLVSIDEIIHNGCVMAITSNFFMANIIFGMNKGLTMLIVLKNLLAQFVCPSPKIWDIIEKGFIGRPLSLSTEEKMNDER